MRYPQRVQVVAVFFAALTLFGSFYFIFLNRDDAIGYNISDAEHLLPAPKDIYASKITYSPKARAYQYNPNYLPGSEIAGDSGSPKITASFGGLGGDNKIAITDPINKVSLGITPKFSLNAPQQDHNRILYPLKGGKATIVYSLQGTGVKEDIILHEYQGDEVQFNYDMTVSDGLQTRLEDDGSLGVYGVDTSLLGNITTGSDKDADILKKARQNGEKNTLIFRIPAPFVLEAKNKASRTVNSWFSLKDNVLTIHARNLKNATYPLSIDPTVYVETAQKLMRGNNETNVDFDTSNELIQKSQTTGARIDAWQDNLDMTQGTWDHGVAAAGGYIYRVGGRTDPTKPSVVSATETLDDTNGTTFTMDMPATRPAGDLYIAIMCHDGSSGSNVSAPVGWQEFADLQGLAAYYKIGADQGGGNEAATISFTGPNEQWAGTMLRITNFNSGDIEAGTPTTTSSSSNATPTFPAITPDANATLIIRGAGFDQDNISATGWVPSGHTKLGSGSSDGNGGNNTCGYAAASLDTSPASGVSTGTASFADSSVNDDYGASTIAINGPSVTPATQATVYWAKFNSSTLAIESPNPGNGTCSGWCTNSAYNLTNARRSFTLVAYNGYLYVMGGSDGTNRQSTVYIAKLGANGEPQLWHPTGGTPTYWYSDTALSNATSYYGAAAYNNRMYMVGGETTGTPNGVTTVSYADIKPNGTLSSWTATSSLQTGAGTHMQTVHIYNGVIYNIGGVEGATNTSDLRTSVYYAKINSDGTLNTWTPTSSFTSARATFGGSYTTVWGAYIYLSGGCTAVTTSYCSTMASDTQIASLNADGTISEWGSISNLQNQRIGYSLIGWQGGLYRLGGCTTQNTSTGACDNALADVDYGVVNEAGEVSTVSISVASGVAPCSGGSPYNCNLPPPGDAAGQGGQMLSMTAILNGYLYVIGGCTDYDCQGTTPGSTDVSGNISYTSIDSSGRLTKPGSCGGTSYGAWCVDSTNRINGTTGVAAAGVTVFNNTIYIVGGLNGSGNLTNIYYNTTNPTTGALSGAWSTSSLSAITTPTLNDISYTYAYSRANPASAGTNPGNLYIFGGCGTNTGGPGCGSNDYLTTVYKCNITTSGSVSGCNTSGQMQIDSTPGTGGSDGLGIHSGTVYANYIYLIGGYSQAEADKDDVIYAKFNDSNNVVAVSGSDWIESPHKLSVGRRRGFSFGYNGHIYSVGGYDDSGTGIIPFIEWSKIDVSSGAIDSFITSSITINQRWGLSMVVSNSYAYVIGGCDVGASPGSCSSFEDAIQTFQLYNNDSGAINNFTANANNFTTSTDRIGAASTVYNGYLYVAGGCTTNTGDTCTAAVNSTQYAAINASDGTLGSWNAGGNLPNVVTWGTLEVAGGTLYYIGGQNSTATSEQSAVYYTTGISSGNPTWGTAANGLPAARTRFGSAVWDNRIYVVGGLNGSAAVTQSVYISPQLNSGGDITSAWTTGGNNFNVSRTGAAVTAYANNLYLFGGFDGTNYLSDVQFASIGYKTGTISQSGTAVTGSGTTFDNATMNGKKIQYPDGSTATITAVGGATSITVDVSKTVAAGSIYTILDGSVGAWSYTTSMPGPLRDSVALSANGYIYLVGGRSAASTCTPKVLITPISANTTISVGNNPTGIGEWYETNVRYSGDRYGVAAAYANGKIYTMGGGCVAPVTSNRHYYSTVRSQPQVAIYSRMIDTDTDVFPTKWLMNGVDNSIGARWQVKYRSMHDNNPTVVGGTDSIRYNKGTITQSGTTVTGSGTNWTSDLVNGTIVYADASTATISSINTGAQTMVVSASKTIGSAQSYTIYQLQQNPNEDCGTSATMSAMTTWGHDYNFGNTTLGLVNNYTPRNATTTSAGTITQSGTTVTGSGTSFTSALTGGLLYYADGTVGTIVSVGGTTSLTMAASKTIGSGQAYTAAGGNINCARYYYFYVNIDASKTFGYPEDVNRGPTIADLSLFFTSDPSKRLRHGKTFTGGELQPLDAPCTSANAACP